MDADAAARTEPDTGGGHQLLSAGQEFRMHWAALAASLVGNTVGALAIPSAVFAIVIQAMSHDLHWSAAQISLGPTIFLLALAAASPAVGWLADRTRPILICVTGQLGLALSLYLFSRQTGNLGLFYATAALMGLIAGGSASVPYARVIGLAFLRARGRALGISAIGTGIAAAVLPLTVAPYAARAGWQAGFVALAIMCAAGAVLVAVLMAFSPAATRKPVGARRAKRGADAATGVAFSQALLDRAFWTMAACIASVSLAAGGLNLNLLRYLEGSGVSVSSAAQIVSIAGFTLMACRALAGWAYDRFFAPRATAVVMAAAGACAIGLAVLGRGGGPLGAMAVGLAIGTQLDAIGYLVARYFGARAFGRIMGVYQLVYLVGTAASITLYGVLGTKTGSFVPAIYMTGALLIISTALYLTLRRYPALPAGTDVPAPRAASSTSTRETRRVSPRRADTKQPDMAD